jgi:hypothetical protein
MGLPMYGQFGHRLLGARFAALIFLFPLNVAAAQGALSGGSVFSDKAGEQITGIAREYGKLPMAFELNQGQANPTFQFLSRGPGYSLFLRPGEAVLLLRDDNPDHATTSGEGAIVRMNLIGADSNSRAVPEEQLVTRTNYLIGNDPVRWQTNVPNYRRVRFRQVYPGIDLRYYGTGQQLEHDFVVAAGADAREIEFKLTGGILRIDHHSGDLLLRTEAGTVRLRAPVAYQDRHGTRRKVAAGYRLLSHYRVGFRLGDYDRSRDLVIDPLLVYSTFLGGTGTCIPQACNGMTWANAVATDSQGNAYITGWTMASDFPTSASAFQSSNHQLCVGDVPCSSVTGFAQGNGNAFVTKISADGTAILYSTYLGGSNPSFRAEQGNAIAVDSQGDAYVAGLTASPDFPTTSGAFRTALPNPSGANVGFISKLNPAGSGFLYSTLLGFGTITGMAVDNEGNAYLTGGTVSPDFPTTPGVFQPTILNADYPGEAFVTKLNPAGSTLVYSTYLGGTVGDQASGIAIDSSGNAYVGGATRSPDFPVTAGAFETTFNSINDTGFVTKLNPSGTALEYSTFLGGSYYDYYDEVMAIAVNTAGNAFVTGATTSLDFPVTSGAFQLNNNGYEPDYTSWPSNAFVTELNTTGSGLVYSTYLGGTQAGPLLLGDYGTGIAIDGSGDAIVAGVANSGDFPTTSDGYQWSAPWSSFSSSTTSFVSRLSPTGSQLLYSSYFGGPAGNTLIAGLAIDVQGLEYVVGQTTAPDLPVSSGAFGAALNAPADAFVAKFDLAAAPTDPVVATPVFSLPSGTYSGVQSVTVSDSTPGALIYCTTDGEPPTYNAPRIDCTGNSIEVTGTLPNGDSGPETLEAVAVLPGYQNSLAATATFTINLPPAPTPTFSLPAGTYSSSQTIALSDAANGATIYYTTDGSTPTTVSNEQYQGPFTLTQSTTVKAIAAATPYSTSALASATYTINLPTPTFTIGGTSVTIASGATAGNTSTITLTPSGGFTGAVSLSCAIAPQALSDPATCSIPASVAISGSTAQTTTLTVNTSAATSALNPARKLLWPTAGGAALACFLLVGVSAPRRRWRRILELLALLLIVTGGVCACGGNGGGGGPKGNPGTTAGTYTITVTGSSGAVTETGTISLTVQ